MAAYLTFRRYRNRWLGLAVPVLLGALLSASVEMAQLFAPSRFTSALDLVDNVIGSAVGVLSGMLFERIARPVRIRVPDRGALALLFVWVGALLFPLYPVMGLFVYRQKVQLLAHSPWFDFLVTGSAAASWFTAGCLIVAAGVRPVRWWLALSILLIPAQIFITGRQPLAAEWTGAVAGTILFSFPGLSRSALPVAGWIFLCVLVARGLAPFHFLPDPQEFIWIPFRGFLGTSWQTGFQFLLEKTFYYGASIWLLRIAVRRLWLAVIVTSMTLAAIEIAQRWLPGRTAEITDPVLALLTGAALWALRIPEAGGNVTIGNS
jgi:VanZ family protein